MATLPTASNSKIQLVWMQPSDWQRHETVVQAGISKQRVRKPKRSASVDAKAAEARRKRVRRIDLGKEDRDALRELARSRGELELEPTPAALRDSAMDGTPRSAKAAGAKLRELTQTFKKRLMLEGGVSPDDLYKVSVRTSWWMPDTWSGNFRGSWQRGVCHLLGHGDSDQRNGGTDGTVWCDEDGWMSYRGSYDIVSTDDDGLSDGS